MSSHPLSARRGSVSAADPYGTRAHLRRPSTSILTIVRLPGSPMPLQEPPQPHKKFARRSMPSAGSQQEHPRLSFAVSSFANGQARPDRHSPSGSPNTSPRMRPSSPRFSQGTMAKPRLSAEQIVEMARQAMNVPSSNPQSPVAPHRPQSPHTHSPSTSMAYPAPATFVPLPDDIYLPFIHRAEEVSQLISTPSTTKLFALLKQAFTNKDDAQLPPNIAPAGDPAQWSYSQLIHLLTKIDRDVCSDTDWVFSTRRCIMSHSELIWERIKAALGVPPELDVEEPEEEVCISYEMDDSAILDSPVTDREEQTQFTTHLSRRLLSTSTQGPGSSAADTSAADSTCEDDPNADEPTPHGVSSPVDNGLSSPLVSGLEELEGSHLTIEPLLSSSGSHPPPLSLPASLSAPASDGGLGDIAEGAEEETEEEGADENKKEGDDLIDPSLIQGLRISTGCFSPSESVIGSPVVNGSVSSLVRTSSESSIQSGSFSLPAAVSSKTGGQSASRDGSSMVGDSMMTGDRLARVPSHGRSYRRTRPASMSGYDPREWDVPYDPVAERGPGNPLFPSNFARLALGPTLRANNPALRSPIVPPASRYIRGKARSQSWVAPRAVTGSDYAVTLASEGSMGE